MDVIVYNDFEFRRDRKDEERKPIQRWVCRQAHKHRCKGKFLLTVPDLENPTVGSTVDRYVDHNHIPDARDFETSTAQSDNDESHIPNSDDEHAISRISEGDFSRDFGEAAWERRLKSSPVLGGRVQAQPSDPELDPSIASPSFVDTSQRDVRGFVIAKRVPRKSGEAPGVAASSTNLQERIADRPASPEATTSREAQ